MPMSFRGEMIKSGHATDTNLAKQMAAASDPGTSIVELVQEEQPNGWEAGESRSHSLRGNRQLVKAEKTQKPK